MNLRKRGNLVAFLQGCSEISLDFFFLQGCLVALDVFKGMLHCLWVFLEGCLVVLEGCLVVLDFFKGMLGGCFRFFRGILDCFGSF